MSKLINLDFIMFRKPGDPSAQRYMVSFYCDKPYEKDGVELISLYVRGNNYRNMFYYKKSVYVLIWF